MTLDTEISAISHSNALADSLEVKVHAIHSNIEDGGTSWIVRVAGDVDWGTAGLLQAHIDGLLSSVHPARLILDLAGVTHVDSSGIGVLLRCLRDANRQSVPFVISGLTGALRRMLERTQLDTLLDVRANIADALRG